MCLSQMWRFECRLALSCSAATLAWFLLTGSISARAGKHGCLNEPGRTAGARHSFNADSHQIRIIADGHRWEMSDALMFYLLPNTHRWLNPCLVLTSPRSQVIHPFQLELFTQNRLVNCELFAVGTQKTKYHTEYNPHKSL